MSTIYLMRHGQTYFNVWHKKQGWTDSPLTKQGIDQARNVGQYFSDQDLKFDKAYASTSERACDTLELVTQNKMSYQRIKGLKEWNFGSFEAQDERLDPPQPYGDFFVKYGGESQKDLAERMYMTISSLMSCCKESDNVLIVSHGGAIANFMRRTGFDWKNFRANYKFTNCSVLRIEYQDNKYNFRGVINEQEYTN